MRNRITWQNVAAPNFSTALAGVRQAGDMFSSGFEDLAGIAGDIRTRQKETASADAITRALGITDPAELAQAVSSGQLYDTRDLTGEALKFFQNQRGSLLGDQQTIASTAGTQARTAASQYALDRAQTRDPILDQRSDQNWDDSRIDRAFELDQRERGIDDQNRADATREMNLEAVRVSDEIINGSLNAEDAKTKVVTQNLDPLLEEAIIQRIDSVDPAQWAVSDLTRQAVVQDPTTSFGTLGEGIDSRRVQGNIAFSTNTPLRLYNDSMERFEGSSNPILNVIEERFQGEPESADLNESRNSIMRDFNSLAKDYPDLPPEVIANVVDQTLEPGGIAGTGFWSGGKLEIDKSAARDRLDAMNTPAARARLESGRQKFKRETERVDNFESRKDKVLDKAALAKRNNDQIAYINALEEAEKLETEFIQWNQSNPTSSYAQEQNILDQATRGSRRQGRSRN